MSFQLQKHFVTHIHVGDIISLCLMIQRKGTVVGLSFDT